MTQDEVIEDQHEQPSLTIQGTLQIFFYKSNLKLTRDLKKYFKTNPMMIGCNIDEMCWYYTTDAVIVEVCCCLTLLLYVPSRYECIYQLKSTCMLYVDIEKAFCLNCSNPLFYSTMFNKFGGKAQLTRSLCLRHRSSEISMNTNTNTHFMNSNILHIFFQTTFFLHFHLVCAIKWQHHFFFCTFRQIAFQTRFESI